MEDIKKLKETILFITGIVSDPFSLGAIKLNKIIWASDVEMFIKTSRSITGATYTKQQFGPVPKHIPTAKKELIEEKKIYEKKTITFNGNEHHIIFPFAEYDESFFEKQELNILYRKMSDICYNHTAMSISDYSHDIIWESASIGEEIPIKSYLAGQTRDIEDVDVEWALTSLGEYGGRFSQR